MSRSTDNSIPYRSSSLCLTASLYANQLRSNLVLLQSSVQAISTRVLIQSALRSYDLGNDTDANWVRPQGDLQSALSGFGTSALLFQAQLVSKNGTGSKGPYGLVNVTGADVIGQIPLPYKNADGTPVYLGDNGTGYPSILYPNLNFTSTPVNSTFNTSTAYYDGVMLHADSTLLLGPWLVNESLALISLTLPIINNTSALDILGWLTVVTNANLVFEVGNSINGLGKTGEILIIGPSTSDNRIPAKILDKSDSGVNKTLAQSQNIRFVLPPLHNTSRTTRHASRLYGQQNTPFPMRDYPAVLDAYTAANNDMNNGGSLINTKNEENDQVSVGYALTKSSVVDWVLVVEQSYGEVIAPIHHLRNVLLASVFGTVGGILLFLFPIAHISVRPIRRLREATKKTVEPYRYPSNDRSVQSFISQDEDGNGSGNETAIARKEGFVERVLNWRGERGENRSEQRRNRLRRHTFRIPGKVPDRKHFVQDELTDLTTTFNEMSEELMMQYERLEERVKERTHQLEISKKAAEAANESKTLFIANISHELKTPLNGILGMCAVCMTEDDQTKIKRSLGIIYKSGDLLLHLLTDLLTFSKNQIGQQLTLEEKEFRLADVSSQVLSIFEKQAKEGAISLTVTFQGPSESGENPSGAPLQVGYGPYGTGRVRDMMLWGDQHRILQVIINLVSNSLKFTKRGGSVFVRIRCVGEVEDKPSSRKNSVRSKLSKQHSARSAKLRDRITSRSTSSNSPTPKDPGKTTYPETAIHINGSEPKSISVVPVRDRSTSPPPLNARTLIFEFEVEDTGPGIPENQQQRVFEPFVQGDLGLSKKYGGTGLGLSICSQLAGLMKGNIVLKSEVGVGSRFTMRIPMVFTKERADSTTSSNLNLNSRRNSINVSSIQDESHTPLRSRSFSDLSIHSTDESVPVMNAFDTPAKPRLVGLSQPFFAAASPLETPEKQLAAMEEAAVQASRNGDKIRVLVAEDNKVNQEVVLRMLKLEDIYGTRSRFPIKQKLRVWLTGDPQTSPSPKTAKKLLSSSKKACSNAASSISSSWTSKCPTSTVFSRHV